MRISDKKFIENYIEWVSESNFTAAKYLYDAFKKEQSEEAKKYYFSNFILNFSIVGRKLHRFCT